MSGVHKAWLAAQRADALLAIVCGVRCAQLPGRGVRCACDSFSRMMVVSRKEVVVELLQG